MILATAFSEERASEGGGRGLRFVIQDRAVVCEMGEKVRIFGVRIEGTRKGVLIVPALSQAWKAKCPELLEECVKFQGNYLELYAHYQSSLIPC